MQLSLEILKSCFQIYIYWKIVRQERMLEWWNKWAVYRMIFVVNEIGRKGDERERDETKIAAFYHWRPVTTISISFFRAD